MREFALRYDMRQFFLEVQYSSFNSNSASENYVYYGDNIRHWDRLDRYCHGGMRYGNVDDCLSN